jgi:transposase-like protein
VTSQKNGVSAMGLKQVLGLGSYQTAWTMLHKLRRAMVSPGRDRLSGVIEVDETYVGGTESGVRGRQTAQKAIVVVAVELHEPRGFGRVRLRRVPDASGSSLLPFVLEAVEPGSQVRTDGWGGYNGLATQGVPAHQDGAFVVGRPRSRVHARSAPRGVAPQALVARNPSGLRGHRSP